MAATPLCRAQHGPGNRLGAQRSSCRCSCRALQVVPFSSRSVALASIARLVAGAARQQQRRLHPQPTQRLVWAQAGADETRDTSTGSAFDFDEPETAREAIDLGLVLCKQEKWDKALAVFQRALTLPGTGVKRFRDKPRLISDSEKMAALFNIACCHARLGEGREGLLALSACLEAGYADFDQILTDPDLELLRQDPRFGTLVQRFQPKSGSFLGIKLPW